MCRTLGMALAAVALAVAAACDTGSPAAADAAQDSAPDTLWDAGPPGDLTPQPDAQDPREALRQRSLLRNGSFEQTAQDGTPSHWTCKYFGQGSPPAQPCVATEGEAVHGKRRLVLAPEVAVFQDAASVDTSKHALFDLFLKRKGGLDPSAAYLLVTTPAGTSSALLRSIVPSQVYSGWSLAGSVTSEPLADATSVRMVIYNTSATEPLEVDDLVLVAEDQPVEAPGHLLRAEHSSGFSCKAGTASTTLYFPLPLDHGVQVPLHVGVELKPASVGELAYELDAEGNLGATLTVKPSTSAIQATLTWKGVALVREATTQELATLSPAKTDVNAWLASTAVVDIQDPGLAAAGLHVTQGLTSAEDKLAAVLNWTSTYVTNAGQLTALDAVSVFNTKNASCTGYANLASAAGRLGNVPTRSVANILVGMAQQTHYINEFYLGSGLGWRLVEPQSTKTVLPPDYAVVLRQILPADEGAVAMAGNHGWSMVGVPSKSLIHPVAGDTSRCSFQFTGAFPECPQCDNKGFYQAPLVGTAAKVTSAFDRARTAWQKALNSFTGPTGPDATEQALRASALTLHDLAGVEGLLQQLEALP
jgi:hypothetical protein